MAKMTTNRSDLSYVAETVAGETPATPAFQLLPITGGMPEFNYTTEMSDTMRSDRQTTDLIVTDAEVTGAVSFELSYAAWKPFLTEVLRPDAAGPPVENGVAAPTTYTFLKRIVDGATTYYFYYTGCVVKSISLDLSSKAKITGTLNLLGRAENATTTMVTGSTFLDVPAGTIMNTSTNIDNLTLDSAAACATSVSLNIENNSEGLSCLGTLGHGDIYDMGIDVTASVETYFEDLARYQLFKDSTGFAFAFGLEDADGNTIQFAMPHCKWESLSVPIGGRNQYVMLPGDLRALRNPTGTNKTIGITFTDA
jgi:hypothetical protein